MPEGRLIPESQLQFSKELAVTVGLEEAILLQQLQTVYLHQAATQRDGLAWLHLSHAYLLQLLPFWDRASLLRICGSLEALGLLRLDRAGAAPECLLLAIEERPGNHQESTPAMTAASTTSERDSRSLPQRSSDVPAHRQTTIPKRGEGEPLPLDFQPSEDMLEILECFHRIPRNFALQQLEDFTLYWRERGTAGHAWQNKFKQHVQFQWTRQQQGSSGASNGGESGTGAARRTRDRSLKQDLTDTSWAD